MGRRLVMPLLAAVCLLVLLVGPDGGEAAGIRRAHAKWTYVSGSCTPRPSDVICFAVKPGERAVADVEVEALQVDVVNPRYVLQTPNGARILRLENASLPPVLSVGGPPGTVQVAIEVPPGFRANKAAGRLYVADKGSVLVPPLNIRVDILHPTPAELALTPVIVPTNHIKLLRDRFNVREFTVVSGTNLTWTNKDTGQHSVKGTLCDANFPFDRLQTCVFDQRAQAAQLAGRCNTPDAAAGNRILCIDSGPLDPEVTFTLRMLRPNQRELLRYYMEDGLDVAPRMKGYVTLK